MTKFNFIYTETSRKISKTYGGSTYTLAVYEVVKNELVYIGEATACTRGHMGEESEAFAVVRKNRPNVIKTLANRIKKGGADAYYLEAAKGSYYTWEFRDYGVSIRKA